MWEADRLYREGLELNAVVAPECQVVLGIDQPAPYAFGAGSLEDRLAAARSADIGFTIREVIYEDDHRVAHQGVWTHGGGQDAGGSAGLFYAVAIVRDNRIVRIHIVQTEDEARRILAAK